VNEELHAIFQGNVQGVGFRATVRHHAQALGIKGTVRNRKDGAVELRAQASKDLLEKLIANLRQEFSGYIQSVSLNYQDCKELLSDFKIIR